MFNCYLLMHVRHRCQQFMNLMEQIRFSGEAGLKGQRMFKVSDNNMETPVTAHMKVYIFWGIC